MILNKYLLDIMGGGELTQGIFKNGTLVCVNVSSQNDILHFIYIPPNMLRKTLKGF